MLLQKIRSFLFPSPYEKWQRSCRKFVELSRVFESRFPESVRFLEDAVNDPKKFLASYGPESQIDGRQFPEVFSTIDSPDHVDPQDLFRDLFDTGFGVYAEVDWKASNEEIYLCVDHMLRGYGYTSFDWSFKDEHDDDTTENYEFIEVIDQRLKGTGYRLASFDPQADSHAFAVVEDRFYKFACGIEPYY